MFAYQLQLPTPLRTEDLVGEITRKSWDVVSPRLKWNPQEQRIESKFREEIKNTFSLYLKTFDLCGSSDVCLDEMRSLIPGNHQCLETKIYHLQLPVRLDLFLDLFASFLTTDLPAMDVIILQKIHDDLKFVIGSILKRYLSTNPMCGKVQICQYSKPISY